MMRKEDCKVGMTVLFGRPNGEKSTGKIVKINPAKARIELTCERGQGRGSEVGSVWTVPYSLIYPVDGQGQDTTAPIVKREPLKFNPFMAGVDQHIVQAMSCVYNDLSPENLTCDGELPRARVQQKSAELHRKLRYLQQAFGQEVTEDDIWAWEQSRREWEKERAAKHG